MSDPATEEKATPFKIEFAPYIRKPFEVMAFEVTKQNIKDVAEQLNLGEVYYNDDGVPYIELDEDRVHVGVDNVYPGYWLTKVGKNNIRAYSRKIFIQQFVESDDDISSWVKYLNGKHRGKMPLPNASSE